MILAWLRWALLALTVEPAASDASSAEIDAIAEELRRGVAQLRVEGAPAPYFAEVRFVRADLLVVDGSYAGLVTDVEERQTAGVVHVRVGQPERDNTAFLGGEDEYARFGLALEPAAAHTRHAVWLALDAAYRAAARNYGAKESVLERLAPNRRVPDFSALAGRPTRRIEPAAHSTFDRAALADLVRELSRAFADHPGIDNGDVQLQILRSREVIVTSEGTATAVTRSRAFLAVTADTQLADGMRVDHGRVLHFQEVPAADEALRAAGQALVHRVLRELDELARAPMIEEEYDGPVLFTGEAAPQLVAATATVALGGTPAPLSDLGRVTELEPAWQRRLGKDVLPPFLDLADDPTGSHFGSYAIDAEGTAAGRLELVRGGRLESLLMTRVPNEVLRASNGRARMTPSLEVGPAVSNLALTSRRAGLSRPALERTLLQLAAEDGYDFAYVIELLRDGGVLGPAPRETANAYAGTGKLDLPLPARIWRVDAQGRRQLVRGAMLAPASVRVLRRIRAVGQRAAPIPLRIGVGAGGGFGHGVGSDGLLSQTVDVAVAAPDLVLEGLEILVERGEHERPPILVHPLRRGDAASTPAPVPNR